jgi:hypothetical protein
MKTSVLTLALLCASPVSAEPHLPEVLVAQVGGTDDGLRLLPSLQFKQGRWQALTSDAALRITGASAWAAFPWTLSGDSVTTPVPLRTDSTVKPFKARWGDSYPGLRIHDAPEATLVLALSLSPQDERVRVFSPPESDALREELTRKVMSAFPSWEEMGRSLMTRPEPVCEGAGAWQEVALPSNEIIAESQFMGCAKGTAELPWVCNVRIARRMVSTKAACQADVWVEAWLVGALERMAVVDVQRGVQQEEYEVAGNQALVLMALDQRLFALTNPRCFDGCSQLSVVEIGSKAVTKRAEGRELPREF